MAEVRIAAFRAHFDAMHVVRIVVLFGDQIFRNRFRESWAPGAAVELVERTKKRFTGDDVDIDPRANIVPIFILKRRLGAVLARDTILVRFQARAKYGIAWHWPVRTKPGGFFRKRMRCERKVEGHANQEGGHAAPHAQADS